MSQQKPIHTVNVMTRRQFDELLAEHEDAIRENIEVLNWQILVAPLAPRTHSDGGIALPDAVQDAEQYLTYIGKILQVGPAYYESDALKAQKRHGVPRVGEYVLYKKFSGMRVQYRGVQLMLMPDDTPLAVIRDIDQFRMYV